MSKIDNKYIQQAVNIRRRYFKTLNSVSGYQEQIVSLNEKLEKYLTDLNDILDKLNDRNNTANKEFLQKECMNIVDIINGVNDDMENIKKNIINPNNKEIEKLTEEEESLYKTLREVYPKLSDEDLIKDIWDKFAEEGLIEQ